MIDLKKKNNLFYLKNIKIQTQIAKNNKSNHRSIPLVAQITLRKSSTNWPSLLSSSHHPKRAWAHLLWNTKQFSDQNSHQIQKSNVDSQIPSILSASLVSQNPKRIKFSERIFSLYVSLNNISYIKILNKETLIPDNT